MRVTSFNARITLNKSRYALPAFTLLESMEVNGCVIPAGTSTDGATVPWIFRLLFPALDRYFPAAAMHDIKCAESGQTGCYSDRRKGDREFKANLRWCGVPRYRAYPMYWGVSLYSMGLRLIGRLK